MALSDQAIAAIEQMLGQDADADLGAKAAAMRASLPGLVVMRCDASDVLEEPFRSYPTVDLHLVDTHNHCTAMTNDPLAATGVLLAVKAVQL